MGVWFLLCHYKPSRLGNIAVQNHINVVKNVGETLFNNRSDPFSRRHVLTGSTLVDNIIPHSFPESVKYLVVILGEFKLQLVNYYESYKPKGTQNRSFFIPDVYRKFIDILKVAVEGLRNDQTELWPLDEIEERIANFNTKK